MADIIILNVMMSLGRADGLRGATLHVGAGEFVAVTGPPGSGKSLLLRLIAGLEVADMGSVHVGENPGEGIGPGQVAAVAAGQPEGERSVRAWLELPALGAGIARGEVRRRTRAAAQAFGIDDILDEQLSSVSSPVRRRIDLARVVVTEPEAVVIDVDLNELGRDLEATFLEELLRIRGKRGTAVVYATPDPDEAMRLGDRVAFMHRGVIEQIGPSDALVTRPATAAVARYLRPDLRLHRGVVSGQHLNIPDLGVDWEDAGLFGIQNDVLVAATPEALASGQPPAPLLLFDPDTEANLAMPPNAVPPVRLEDAGREAAAEGSEPRYVNVAVMAGDQRIPPTVSLDAHGSYVVSVAIGAYDSESIVSNARETPFPDKYLPDTEDGHWLEVVASSGELSVPEPVQRMFLPVTGRAWSCDCAPSGPHRCTSATRRDAVNFPITAPPGPVVATLRLTVYHALNAIQSLLLTANVGRNGGLHCVIDYSLTAHLAGVGHLRPRALSIVTNEGPVGTHTLYVNGRNQDPFSCVLSDVQIGPTVNLAREYLFDCHIKKGEQNELAYGARNEKSRGDFIDDLRILAGIGYKLLTDLFPYVDKRNLLVDMLRGASAEQDGEAVIQVARTAGCTQAFPWYLIYDIAISPAGATVPCPFLQTWDPAAATPTQLPPRCPQEEAHSANVLCPYGFWGFAHIIELPPFVDVGLPVRRSIRRETLDAPMSVMLGISPELNPGLTAEHVQALKTLFPSLAQARTCDEVLKAISVDLDVVYFYCHGETETSPAGQVIGPLLKLADGDYMRPQDVQARNPPQGSWPQDHWEKTRPLVVINGCHTTSLSPEVLSDFVKAFVGSRAAGVIGTEVSIHQQVANEAAREFFEVFHGDRAEVGRAVQKMRRSLLAKGNVMGLAYNAYCSEGLTVQPPEDTP